MKKGKRGKKFRHRAIPAQFKDERGEALSRERERALGMVREAPVELCWVRLVGRDHLGNVVTQFNVLLRADMKLCDFFEFYSDAELMAEIHEPDITSEQQPVPLVGPGLRIVNLSEA